MEYIELNIGKVPNDEVVIEEILANARATVKNFLDRTVRIVPPEKEAEAQAVLDDFDITNEPILAPFKPVEPVVDAIIVK